MSQYKAPQSHIHYLARGLMIRGDEVLLCRLKGNDWFFLPGGHVEDGESARVALKREFREETGSDQYRIGSFIGAYEYMFLQENNEIQHELNVVFIVPISENIQIDAIEDHLEYVAVFKKDLISCDIRPEVLKNCVIDYLEDEKIFFKEIK